MDGAYIGAYESCVNYILREIMGRRRKVIIIESHNVKI